MLSSLLIFTVWIVSILQVSVWGYTIPSLSSSKVSSVLSIITTDTTDAVDNKDESSGAVPSPYEELIEGDNKLVKEIVAGLNRTSLGPLQAEMNLYYSKNRKEAIEYCKEKVMTALNGSLTQTKDGCEFILQCTYDPNRFPALLLKGACGQSYQLCGAFPDIKSCISYDVRVSVLNYAPTNSAGYQLAEKDTIQESTKWEWLERRELLTTDCLCEF